MARPHDRPPLAPADRFRMRRLSDEEMDRLCSLARDGRKGPYRALEALWDLVLREAEGVSVAEAAARPGSFRVQDYSVAADQNAAIYAAMVDDRQLPARAVNGFRMQWFSHSPCDHIDDAEGS